jgi:adenylate cyclase
MRSFIVASATAFAYKDKPVTVQQVGRDLGVRFVLQGSVQRSGTKIRINAQLADANSNAQLWSESFEGDQSDLFVLQDRVTTLVGNSIGREMVVVAARESEIRKTNPKVGDLMLRARAIKVKPQSFELLQQIQDLCREALALESNNAAAMAGLAVALELQALNFAHRMDDYEVEKKKMEAHALAMKAKGLDPEIPGIYWILAAYADDHGDFLGSRRAHETHSRLRQKIPSYFYGVEPNKAIELLTQAINLDPKHPDDFNLLNMGRAYFMLGDNNAAIEWILKSMEKDSNHPAKHAYLAMAYALKEEHAKASAAAADLRRVDPDISFLDSEKAATLSSAFKDWYEYKLLPAARKAGFIE